jgi:hypothetical protein
LTEVEASRWDGWRRFYWLLGLCQSAKVTPLSETKWDTASQSLSMLVVGLTDFALKMISPAVRYIRPSPLAKYVAQ